MTLTRANVRIYLVPNGLRVVEGYVSPCGRVGVARLECTGYNRRHSLKWFAFTQESGARLTDGWANRWAAAEEGLEQIRRINLARGRFDMRDIPHRQQAGAVVG